MEKHRRRGSQAVLNRPTLVLNFTSLICCQITNTRARAIASRSPEIRRGAPSSEEETFMATSSFGTLPGRRWHWPALRLTRGDVLRYTGLALVVALAVWLRFANLDAIGQSNT